ncbi:MAG: endolytic transglycosylase MltG, partial [Candidatus Sungiibacteriota bacterium]
SAGRVVAVELIPELCEFGKANIDKYGFIKKGAVRTICGDATPGIPDEAPFNKIIAAAAASKELPKAWRDELKVGGIIVSPIGASIWRFTKKSDNEWREEEFPGFAFVPLIAGGAKTEDEEKPKPRRVSPDEKNNKGIYFPIFLLIAGILISYLFYAAFAPLKLNPTKIEIVVAEGTGARAIAEDLKEKKLIRSKWLFLGWALITGRVRDLKAGDYVFEKSADIPEVVKRLYSGEELPNERIITIPEGWNLDDIGEYLESQGVADKKDFRDVAGLPHAFSKETEAQKRLKERFPFLSELPPRLSFEGYLFPDTYRIFRSAAAEEVTAKMLDNFQKKLTPDLISEIKRQNKTLFQIITMASLIEKEVPHEEDRAIISGILWKRFGLGMGLQVDATINYILQTTNNKQPTTKISIEDTAIDSPYNTYKYRGLPVGPISNPGLSAIRAAIFPKSSPYLYYLSTPEGKTIFSETLEEHNAAKAKYLR